MQTWRQSLFPAVLAAGFWVLMASPSAATPEPMSLYGDDIRFDVLRKGEVIGRHTTTFAKLDDTLKVRSQVDLQVRFLALFSFRYRYQSEALWAGGQLQRLKTDVNDDGDTSSLLAIRTGPQVRVTFGDKTYTTEAPLIPTNHWNAAVLGETRVLNTLTGNINDVRLEPLAREPVRTERGEVMATRYNYAGDLDTEIWYDDRGRWVKLRFAGRDGTPIEYQCRRCQGGADRVAKP